MDNASRIQSKRNERMALNDQSHSVQSNKERPGLMWKSCLVGGIPGILLGAAGTFAGNEVATAAENIHDFIEENNGSVEIHEMAPVSESVSDDMSFAEAFAAARQEVGAGGVFSWQGQIYGTYYQNEWAAMSDDQKQEYAQSVSAAGVCADAQDEVLDSGEMSNGQDVVQEDLVLMEETGSEENGVSESGSGIESPNHIEVVGVEEQILGDADDIVAIGDGADQLDEMSPICEQVSMPEDILYADMADYTNDADVSSLC